jgi:hypothetical protein
MNSIKTSVLVFSLLLGGALLGKYSSPFLSPEHLKGVQLGVGLLTSMFGLLLGLQLSAGKTYFDMQEQDVTLMASRMILLDSVLAGYGPEAREARALLRAKVEDVLMHVWPKESSAVSTCTPEDEIGVYGKKLYSSAIDDRGDRVGDAHFSQLRPVSPTRRSGYCQSGPLCGCGFKRILPDRRNE